jgi:hypothetical protein
MDNYDITTTITIIQILTIFANVFSQKLLDFSRFFYTKLQLLIGFANFKNHFRQNKKIRT